MLVLAATTVVAGPIPHEVPRTIVAFYDGRQFGDVNDTPIHQWMEMPLNHLGLKVRYYDVNGPLPEPSKDIRGILTAFTASSMAHPQAFIEWVDTVLHSGARMVVAGVLGVDADLRGNETPPALIERLQSELGFRLSGTWVSTTSDVRILHKETSMVEFERPLGEVLPQFTVAEPIDRSAHSWLVVERANQPQTRSHLVMTAPKGGYISPYYINYRNPSSDQFQWYVNPFEFFRVAFATDEIPKPDTTTIAGRRIFYSHIDGDGWRNTTEVEPYTHQQAMSAEVILREVIERYPDLPVTVAPIAGDLDPAWYGTGESAALARRILSLPQVEAGSHTYSHPLDWEFLARHSSVKDQSAGAVLLAGLTGLAPIARMIGHWKTNAVNEVPASLNKRGNSEARSYSLYPFRLEQEIQGSIDYIRNFLPAGKNVAILQWSGSTLASREAIAATRAAGVRNINGGDTRFDAEYPSYRWVAPLGRQIGDQQQIFSSASNENTYTDEWRGRFFGYRFLVSTLRNTESPVRVKPVNFYYHMFSGQKEVSLRALLDDLAYARTLEIAPIRASEFAGIADGFYSVRLIDLGGQRWRIENRDLLQTFRIDHAEQLAVDFARSSGVIGQRHYQGSLYVALDPAEAAPVIALQEWTAKTVEPAAVRPYLVDSRWQISGLRIDSGSCSFEAQGFGNGQMRWQMPGQGNYRIEYAGSRQFEARTSADGFLRFELPVSGSTPVEVRIRRAGSGK